MTVEPVILAVGCVDAVRIAGSTGIDHAFASLGRPAPGDGRTFRAVFGQPDETFRRLDAVSRALVLAGAAAGLPDVVPVAERNQTALLVETEAGCLDADLRFAYSLAAGLPEGPMFPYTLPSTCLGELALRHGLRGYSNCLCVDEALRGAALREARACLASGEAQFAVVAAVEVLTRACAALPRRCEVLLAVLATPAAAARHGLAGGAPLVGGHAAAWEAVRALVPRAR